MPQQDKPQPSTANRDDALPFVVELWDESRASVEKILARAFRLSLAQAIFHAALEEHPGRRITLRHAGHILEDQG